MNKSKTQSLINIAEINYDFERNKRMAVRKPTAILKRSAVYYRKDLDRQITSNPYATFLILRKETYIKHKSQGHFETDSLGHSTYRGVIVTHTSKGE